MHLKYCAGYVYVKNSNYLIHHLYLLIFTYCCLLIIPRLFTFALMKSYFIRLFDYDASANKQMTELLLQWPDVKIAAKLMGHVLAAQERWLTRCKGLPSTGGSLWPDWPAEKFGEEITANNKNWLDYLETLNPQDFEQYIVYQNSTGETFSNQLSDILAHLINHGTHHRAQVGQHLKLAGAALPPSDYIFYVRDLDYTL